MFKKLFHKKEKERNTTSKNISKASVNYAGISPQDYQKAMGRAQLLSEWIDEYMIKDHPMDSTMTMLGVQRTKPTYQVVSNQVVRTGYPHIDMKIVSVASCLPAEDIAINDTQKIARKALEAIQHYASISIVNDFFLIPFRIKGGAYKTVIPLEEQCRVYAGVENLLLEIYDELPPNGTITDAIVKQKIDQKMRNPNG
jgi:hypothetical protein